MNLPNLKAIHKYFSRDAGGNRQGICTQGSAKSGLDVYDKTKGGEIEHNRMKIYGKIPAIINKRTVRHLTPPLPQLSRGSASLPTRGISCRSDLAWCLEGPCAAAALEMPAPT